MKDLLIIVLTTALLVAPLAWLAGFYTGRERRHRRGGLPKC